MARASRWSPEERRVLDAHVAAFAQGKYRSPVEAARGFQREIERLRDKHPRALRLSPRRKLSAVCVAIRKRRIALRLPPPLRHSWTVDEDRLVARYAQKLADGRFPSMLAAAGACMKALTASRGTRFAAGAKFSTESVRDHMRRQMKAQGLNLPNARLTSGEARVVDHHIQALLEGRHRDARKAAEACHAELSRLPRSAVSPRVRTLVSIQRRIDERCRKAGRIGSHAWWRPDEDAVVGRFAYALVQGRYSSIETAARACRNELMRASLRRHRRSQTGNPYSYCRSVAAVRARVLESAHGLGRPKVEAWSRREMAAVDRHVRALFEGRYRYAREAAAACTRELARVRGRGRSEATVHDVLSRRATSLGLPRYKSQMDPRELRLVEQYARRLDQGTYRSWAEAARACNSDLLRLYAADSRRIRLRRRVSGHSLVTVLGRMHELARRLGLKGPGRPPFWGDAEIKLLNSWLQWYERHQGGRVGRGPLRQASEGLQEDIENLGIHRTIGACADKLMRGRRILHGVE